MFCLIILWRCIIVCLVMLFICKKNRAKEAKKIAARVGDIDISSTFAPSNDDGRDAKK